jgi:hypothetical protein
VLRSPGASKEVADADDADADAAGGDDESNYHPVLWGYYRAVRFAGDLTDLGVEIQVEDFETQTSSHHLDKQQVFASQARFDEPFSVDKFRHLLVTAVDEES